MPRVGFTKAVPSSKGDGAYTVTFMQNEDGSGSWSCECKGFQYRGACRHVEQVSAEVEAAEADERQTRFSIDDDDDGGDTVPF